MSALNEVWMLHVALHNEPALFSTLDRAKTNVIIMYFLGEGTWENPKGKGLPAGTTGLIEKLLAKVQLKKFGPKR